MDYRDKNPKIEKWVGNVLKFGRIPFPFGSTFNGIVFEYDDPEYTTTFFSLRGDSGEDDDFNIWTTSYLIEAQVNCPMRKAFIFGEVTWGQYWFRKLWLLELSMKSIFATSGPVRYINPSEMTVKNSIRFFLS